MNKKSQRVPNMQRRPSRKQQAQGQAEVQSSGFQAQQEDGVWKSVLQDELGSVRSVVDNDLAVLQNQSYAPYGSPFGLSGTEQTMYGYTGESVDSNELVYLRNRYYSPSMGTFVSQDPYEGSMNNPMSLNRYSYVQGNPVNMTDPNGMIPGQVREHHAKESSCVCQDDQLRCVLSS